MNRAILTRSTKLTSLTSRYGKRSAIAALALALIVLLSFSLYHNFSSDDTTNSDQARLHLPALDGDKAVEHLKQAGLYDSLGEAMRAARYSINPVEQPERLGVERGSYYANNPSQNYRALFTSEDLRIEPQSECQSWRTGMRLAGYGYGERLMTVSKAELKSTSARIEYHREAEDGSGAKIVEWYENRAEGLEQGFTIAAAPTDKQEGERLTVALDVTGDLTASASESGQSVTLKKSDGASVLSYDRLWAMDVTGRELTARMRVEGSRVFIEVDDAGAEYPVTIDPTFSEQQKLTASDAATRDSFGRSIAIDGETVVVGAPRNNHAGAGAAYVFVRVGAVWTQQQKLTSSDAAAGDVFGESVAIDGETIVIGAYQDDNAGGNNAGSAYVFVRTGTTWAQQQKLIASDTAADDLFGISVAIDGETVVVGAYQGDHASGVDAGAAYVFVRAGTVWSEQQKLTASDADIGDLFGYSVALDDETIVVGALGEDNAGGIAAGAAYIFVRAGTTWTEQQKLTASDADASDQFGHSVAIDGETVAIGAFGSFNAGSGHMGAAYVFVRVGAVWTEQQRLTPSDAAAFDGFGWSIAINGETIVVGALGDNHTGGAVAGSAYAFVRAGTTWTEQQKLTASDADADDQFGHSVAIDGKTVVIGSPQDDHAGGADAGSAYVFVCAQPGNWTEQAKSTASDAAPFDNLGVSVAIDGETAIVGAPSGDDGGLATGAAYIFVRLGSNWTHQQKLTASDAASLDNFGASVAIDGETAIIGAPFDNHVGGSDAGAVYVFVRIGSVWTEQQKLTASDATANDRFSASIAISGETVVISAPGDDNAGGMNTGAAYVFVRTGSIWSEQQKLTTSDATGGDVFGASVAISGETVVVGAPFHNASDLDAGAAYVFQRTGTLWTQQQKLTASDTAIIDHFGTSVAVDGETAIIGARFYTRVGDMRTGAVYVFVRAGTTWTQQQKLTASDATVGDFFGTSVAISGETVIVGESSDSHAGGISAGATYVFVRVGTIWSEQQKLIASDAADGDGFGISLAIDGETIVVGAYLDDHAGGTDAGSVYVFVRNCMTCTSITCPQDITAVAPPGCPPASGVVVNYPPPGTDNCQGTPIVCSPPSGSLFPLGATTVTCTANQTVSCSFTVTVFNGCLQDDANPANVVLFNTQTGDYRFCCNGSVLASGRGTLTLRGCTVTIQHNAAGRRVTISEDFAAKRGSASLQMPVGTVKCAITDKNTTNNTCQCQ